MSITALFSQKDIFTRGGASHLKEHSFKKSGTNFYKNGAGGGSKAIYKLYKKTDVLEKDVVP